MRMNMMKRTQKSYIYTVEQDINIDWQLWNAVSGGRYYAHILNN